MDSKINRRAFVKNTSTMLAGMGLGLAAQGKSNEKNSLADIDKRKGIELAIASICLDGFGDENFKNVFEIVPKTGIKNIEFNVWYSRNFTPSGISSIMDRCYETGLRPISLQGTSFGGHVGKDVGHKMWLMEKAKELGCRRVKFTGSKRGTAGGLESVIEALKALAPVAEEMDVVIAVENHANNNIENIDDYKAIFDQVDSSHIGVCLDMGHFDGASVDNLEVVKEFHEKINHVDIKDTIEFGKYKTVPYGQGVTKGEKIIKALVEKNYTGYLIIEQAPPIEGMDLATEMERIRKIFTPFEK
ncbi:sugar phosphate isomerase/epimerase family protein [Flexithrix dorotheae]|uniref:sugar phosphate isomerase/epimerase family protein n=1 Tax=Flexithrix dorotheae TaxID=70993 RepID=UPI00037D829E|nr:sugar phosphate isomerase/epimerase family protein [Flexithrix dorotheae]